MNKNITIDYQEIERYNKTIDDLRRTIDNKNSIIQNLQSDLKFLKEKGDGILVIEKGEVDTVEFKSTEKELLLKMVSEYSHIREALTDLINEHRKILLEKETMKSKISSLESNIAEFTNELVKLNSNYDELKNRSFFKRILNLK
jgi:chromosome segregation ATPase